MPLLIERVLRLPKRCTCAFSAAVAAAVTCISVLAVPLSGQEEVGEEKHGRPQWEVSLLSLITVVSMVLAVALCVGKGAEKASSETSRRSRDDGSGRDITDEDDAIQAPPRGESTSLVQMEGNPTFTSSRLPSVDEDEMANQKMTAIIATSPKKEPVVSFTSALPPWLHTKLTKGEAIDVLRSHASQVSGLFLIRSKRNNPGHYVLDLGIMENNSLTLEHYSVMRSATGEFTVNDRPCKTGPRSIEAVVAELKQATNLIRHKLVCGVERLVDDDEQEPHISHVSEDADGNGTRNRSFTADQSC